MIRRRAQLTLARAARADHERAVEPRLTAKHAAQWIAALENHINEELWQRAARFGTCLVCQRKTAADPRLTVEALT